MAQEYINNIVLQIFRDNCVTVIGSGAILKSDKTNNDTGNSHIMLLKQYATIITEKWNDDSKKEIDDIKTENGFWDFFHEQRVDWSKSTAKIHNTELENLSSSSHWADGLIDLLKSLRIVFTTSTDCLLEKAYREAVGEEEIKLFNLLEEDNSDFVDFLEKNIKKGRNCPRAIVYLFGKIDDHQPFAYSEPTYVEAISKLYTKINGGDKTLDNFFKFDGTKECRKLLMIGCDFDDWRFRFLWYAIAANINLQNDNNKRGTVAFTGMSQTLKDEVGKTAFIEDGTRQFLSELGKSLNDEKVKEWIAQDFRANGKGVFVSYKHKDADAVRIFVIKLRERGYKVWFDESELYPGDVYDEMIRENIAQCGSIIIALTEHVCEDIKKLRDVTRDIPDGQLDGKLEEYYKSSNETAPYYIVREWRRALKRKEPNIIPLSFEGYDHTIVDNHTSFDSLMRPIGEMDVEPHTNYDKIKTQLDNYLGINTQAR